MIMPGGYRGILGVMVVTLVMTGGVAKAISLTDTTLDTTLSVVQSQSNINTSLNLSASGLSDSDTDNSAISGTMDAKFGLDFSSGKLGINSLQFTGGDLILVKNMHYDITLKALGFITVFDMNIDTVGVGGSPNTPIPGIVSPVAKVGNNGQFAASPHEIILNEGSIVASGDLSQTLPLSSNPISGASSSSTPGQIVIVQTGQDLNANTTAYSITLTTPIGVNEVIEQDTDYGLATIIINGTGSIRSTTTNLVANFIPWNGVFGDLNQDGFVTPLDIETFKMGWRSTNSTPGLLAIQKGDLNFDGVTDLHDAFLLRTALQGNNLSFSVGDLLAGSAAIPEPSTCLLLAAGCAAWIVRRRAAKG